MCLLLLDTLLYVYKEETNSFVSSLNTHALSGSKDKHKMA